MTIIIYLTKFPRLTNFKPVRRIELLRSGLYQNFNGILTPVWEGGDLYPIDDLNWDNYLNCIKENKKYDWKQVELDIF